MAEATDATPAASLLDRFSGDQGAETAAAWRASLPDIVRGALGDELIERVDELAAPSRRRVLRRWRAALRAGVMDQPTLAAIADTVADAG